MRSRPYGEADRIVTLLTPAYGKLTGIAKGAKRSWRRFGNCLEPFARVEAYFAARAGASLVFLERCELRHAAQAMSLPSRFAYGCYLLELVDQLTPEDQPAPEVFDLLEAALDQVEIGPVTAAFLRAFELQLLRVSGWAPSLEACSQCRTPFEPEHHGFFDDARGTFLCARCRASGRGAERIPSGVLAILARLQGTPLCACREWHLEPALAQQAVLLTGRLLAPHLPRPLRSLDLIGSLSRDDG